MTRGLIDALWLLFHVAIWVFGIGVCGFMLTTIVQHWSTDGGWLYAGIVVYVLVFAVSWTAFTVVGWKKRKPSARNVSWIAALRSPQPTDDETADVWWWMRLAIYSWLSIVGCIAFALLAVLIGRVIGLVL